MLLPRESYFCTQGFTLFDENVLMPPYIIKLFSCWLCFSEVCNFVEIESYRRIKLIKMFWMKICRSAKLSLFKQFARTRWCIPNLEYFSSIFSNPLTYQRAWVVATAGSSTTSELLKETTMLLVSHLDFCCLLEPKSAISSIPGVNVFSSIWISNIWIRELRMFLRLSFVVLV